MVRSRSVSDRPFQNILSKGLQPVTSKFGYQGHKALSFPKPIEEQLHRIFRGVKVVGQVIGRSIPWSKHLVQVHDEE